MKFAAVIISLLTLSILTATNKNAVFIEDKTPLADENQIVYLPFTIKSIDEYGALMALYNSTKGPSWINNTGWGVGDPCDMAWYGVECDSGHVQRLNLDSNQLSGPIPVELGYLKKLEELFLRGNQLSGPIPDELGYLSSLERLVLRGNQLSSPIPDELGSLSRLEVLNLRDNQLSGPIPAELENLSSLRWLGLENNPALVCWQTEEALIWAQGLTFYGGPDAVCP